MLYVRSIKLQLVWRCLLRDAGGTEDCNHQHYNDAHRKLSDIPGEDDAADDNNETLNDTMRVIYMYHNKEPQSPGNLPDPVEAFKQARSLFLTQRINQAPLKPDPRLRTMELLNQDVNLPQGDGTLHWCKMFKLNDINRKHHLIRDQQLERHLVGP
uniref:Uncharacterized protein n=1 Tax=Anopheles maculatus TaxID=74869 RepID=A0A182SCW1_9DIPT